MGWDRVGDEISGGRGHAHMRWLCWWSTVRLYSFPLFRARFPLPPFLYPKYFNSLPHPIISLFFLPERPRTKHIWACVCTALQYGYI